METTDVSTYSLNRPCQKGELKLPGKVTSFLDRINKYAYIMNIQASHESKLANRTPPPPKKSRTDKM